MENPRHGRGNAPISRDFPVAFPDLVRILPSDLISSKTGILSLLTLFISSADKLPIAAAFLIAADSRPRHRKPSVDAAFRLLPPSGLACALSLPLCMLSLYLYFFLSLLGFDILWGLSRMALQTSREVGAGKILLETGQREWTTVLSKRGPTEIRKRP
ncbi:hypothetical protein TIFTF001_001833 [Ficus carica]|uniref:Uncharacterized protein n=1 Tax=Ficus carica TaxID=3494 RepID=A0AA87Z3B3_FICCA|nr:hypothetical protein TIFTF001_001833 [Ficus carica]